MKQKPLFSVIYEDDDLIGVNKSSGLSVGGDRWDSSRERLDRLVLVRGGEAPGAGPERKALFTVHRIDRDASGLVVFAKNAEAHRRLSLAFETRQVKKRYIAAVYGRPLWEETACDLPLVPDGNKQHHTIIDRYRGKKSFTRFRLLLSAGVYSIVEALPETGRTHQIRVHLAALGHPIVCDEFYGALKPALLSAVKREYRGDPAEERPLLARLGLHAAELELPGGDPRGGSLALRAPLPRDMAALVRQMEKAGGGPPQQFSG